MLIYKFVGVVVVCGLLLVCVVSIVCDVVVEFGMMGVVFDGCMILGVDKLGFSFVDYEIELGFGIYGEKGVECCVLLLVDVLVDMLLLSIVVDFVFDCDECVVLFVNGFGVMLDMEFVIVLCVVFDNLSWCGIVVVCVWVGMFLFVLNMLGCLILVLWLNDECVVLFDVLM